MKKVLMFFITSIGFAFILYPIISNYFNVYNQTILVTKYEDEIKNLNEDERKEKIEEAVQYNNKLKQNEGIDISLEEEKIKNSINITTTNGILGYIVIPKIEVNLPIYYGITPDVLRKGVGNMENSSLPIGGESTHSVLAGHTGLARGKIFDNIKKLVHGDKFYINTLGIKLEYEVDNIMVVEPTDANTLKIIPGKDYVTLLTCTPALINSHRLLVRGERVQEKSEEVKLESKTELTKESGIQEKLQIKEESETKNEFNNRKTLEIYTEDIIIIICIIVLITILILSHIFVED